MVAVADKLHRRGETEGAIFEREALRHVAMPLGGLGAGQIAICGDGGLRQWQMVNQANHVGFVPDSFFAIRASCTEPPLDTIRVLQSREVLALPKDHTPLVNDDYIPADQEALLGKVPGVERTTFVGAYPFARIGYEDSELPLEVELEAYSPFIPLDTEASGLPAIQLTFRLRSQWPHELHGCLGASLQNAVGWDGVTPISDNRCPLYGGNTNDVRRSPDRVSIVMRNPELSSDHPCAGQMVLAALTPTARPYERWTSPEQFVRFIEGFNAAVHLTPTTPGRHWTDANRPVTPGGGSPKGETWNGGLLVPYRLAPGEATTITFVIAWYFPNRYVNFDQFGARRDYGKTQFWLGNAYATRFADAGEVVDHLVRHGQAMEQKSRAWARGLHGATLPTWLAETLAAQGSLMRSPTCFWTEDGKFYGFEGALGASTAMWNASFGGSCPLNCTHVWNYEQALSRLFPQLERTMRETDLEHVQAPEGYLPHRTVLPLYLQQFWGESIGGPTNPALDGMLGEVLKCYREARQGAGREWLGRLWPRIRRLLEYVTVKWDPDHDGVLEGEQPNTYDIAFYGPNMYIGALWLAALRAAEEMARILGDPSYADELRELFERGSGRYDELLWNGEYYGQLVDPDAPPRDQFGEGCLADQLLGQWWAHQLELGYVLPEEHVRTTLRSILTYNIRRGFRGFEHGYRVFADRDDVGLLVCTWPRGGRPEVPVRYCDEVWTGIEYQVAAHCIMEGMVDEGLELVASLRARYSGIRRNPYNEIECGDHYARAMAGWSVLEAVSGYRYDALGDSLRFAPVGSPREFAAPFVAGSGWGAFEMRTGGSGTRVELTCAHGTIRIRRVVLGEVRAAAVTASVNGEQLLAQIARGSSTSTVTFAEPILLKEGDHLEIADRT